jgi:hypothetical protein
VYKTEDIQTERILNLNPTSTKKHWLSGEEADPEGAKFAIFSNDEGGDGTDSDASGGESESS